MCSEKVPLQGYGPWLDSSDHLMFGQSGCLWQASESDIHSAGGSPTLAQPEDLDRPAPI